MTNKSFVFNKYILVCIILITNFQAQAGSYWIFGYENSLNKYKYYIPKLNEDLFFNEKKIFIGKSADNFDFYLNYGSSSNDFAELRSKRLVFNYKYYVYENMFRFPFSIGSSYDFSQITYSNSDYNNNAILVNLVLGVEYRPSPKYSISSNLMSQRSIVNLASEADARSMLGYEDNYSINLNFGINFDK